MSIAIISGASAGIGLETARVFLRDGHRVINISRRPCPESQVENWRVDLSRPDSSSVLEGLIATAFDDDRRENVHLVHNASRLAKDDATDTSDKLLEEVLRVNVASPNTLNRLLIPYMSQGSSIVFVGSTLSEKAVAGSFSYVTSKHAQIGMMRSLCQDLHDTGIHTAAVCPGFTDTEMLRSHVGPETLTAIAELNSFRRLIDPEEIAKTIFWISQNPVINGSVLHANLGQIER